MNNCCEMFHWDLKVGYQVNSDLKLWTSTQSDLIFWWFTDLFPTQILSLPDAHSEGLTLSYN